MDARFPLRTLSFIIAISIAGCADFQGGAIRPDTHRDAQPDPNEPPLIVKSDERAETAADKTDSIESFGDVIMEYIKRIDQAEANNGTVGGSKTPQPPRRAPQLIFEPGEDMSDTETASAVPPRRATKTVPQNAASPTAPEPEVALADTEDQGQPEQIVKAPSEKPPAVPTIRPVQKHETNETPPDALATASINGVAIAHNAPQSLREFVAQLPPPPDDEAPFADHLDRRILLALAGEYDQAREPLPMASHEQAEIATRFVDSLIAIREGHLGDPTGAATSALREIEKLADSLRQISDLSVGTLEICREVRAFGQYSTIQPREFRTGSPAEFVLYCEVSDFTTKRLDDGQVEARFELTTTILDHGGGEIMRFEDRDLIDRCRTRRRDCFIPRLIRLPATLSPGEYVAKVTLVDKLGDKVVERQTDFRITAR